MPTYYEYLDLPPNATADDVEMGFRWFLVRHRPAADVEQIFTSPSFRRYLNAYLTLKSPLRAHYDELLSQFQQAEKSGKIWGNPPEFNPLEELTPTERRMLIAQAAHWRRQSASAVHLLRLMLDREPGYAAGWALLGEVFFSIDHLDDGIRAYERAVQAVPRNGTYQARLQHALDAATGKIALEIEPSPEDLLLRKERKQRLRISIPVGMLALSLLGMSGWRAVHELGFLFIPWNAVFVQMAGFSMLWWALGYGRLAPPYERVMLWATTSVFDRGRLNNYPTGLLLLVTGVSSMWLAVLTIFVLAYMDEEWPVAPSLMVGGCALGNVALILLMNAATGHWGELLLFGGNLPIIAAMLGWWLGSTNSQRLHR